MGCIFYFGLIWILKYTTFNMSIKKIWYKLALSRYLTPLGLHNWGND